jgi:hypothetical protein
MSEIPFKKIESDRGKPETRNSAKPSLRRMKKLDGDAQ